MLEMSVLYFEWNGSYNNLRFLIKAGLVNVIFSEDHKLDYK